MIKKLFTLLGLLVALGLQLSSVQAASTAVLSNASSAPMLVSDDEEIEQDVYNAGEDFYIWTTTITKVA